MTESTKYLLPEDKIPTSWYNLVADLPKPPAPVLHPGTGQPVGPGDLAPLFPMAVIMQEVSAERDDRDSRSGTRHLSPVAADAAHPRAAPGEGARIRRPRSSSSTRASALPGSHKPNTAVAQAFYNKQEGVKRLTTETGAGQWGSSLAFAGQLFGLEVEVYMVKVSYEQKPYRRALMETYGARCIAEPIANTANRAAPSWPQDPDSTGSLGIAISEAVEMAAQRDDTKYSLGSVLNHVLLHQTVIGEEAMLQLADGRRRRPTSSSAAPAAARNFAGIAFPFIGENGQGPHERPHHRRRAGLLSHHDARHLRLRFRRHRPPDAPGQDAHAGLDLHASPASMRAACAITAWRRSSATSRNWA